MRELEVYSRQLKERTSIVLGQMVTAPFEHTCATL